MVNYWPIDHEDSHGTMMDAELRTSIANDVAADE